MADGTNSVNHIHFLYDDQDRKIESQKGIRELCVDYFANLLGGETSTPTLIQYDMDLLLPFRCSQTQIRELELGFTARNIKEAFLALPKNKTCGPDGYFK